MLPRQCRSLPGSSRFSCWALIVAFRFHWAIGFNFQHYLPNPWPDWTDLASPGIACIASRRPEGRRRRRRTSRRWPRGAGSSPGPSRGSPTGSKVRPGHRSSRISSCKLSWIWLDSSCRSSSDHANQTVSPASSKYRCKGAALSRSRSRILASYSTNRRRPGRFLGTFPWNRGRRSCFEDPEGSWRHQTVWIIWVQSRSRSITF